MRAAILIAALLGCTDPEIDMQVVMSSQLQMKDASCVTAVEVHATGKDYPNDPMDFTSKCMHLAGATYGELQGQMHGAYTIKLPATGLGGVEVYGWASPIGAPDPCLPQPTQFTTPDLAFFSSAKYVGQSQIDLPIQPNLGCTATQLKVRMVDVFAASSGTSPSSASCAAAEIGDSMNAGVGIGSMVSKLAGVGTEFFGNLNGANLSGGLATFNGLTEVDSSGCLALSGSDDLGGSTSCVVGGTPVCAGPGETELGYVTDPINNSLFMTDQALVQQWHGMVIGAVWTSGATRTPIAGATITIDPMHGVVEYIDPPPMGSSSVAKRSDGKTGPSGLFVVYVDTVVQATVAGNGLSRNVLMASPDDYTAVELISLP